MITIEQQLVVFMRAEQLQTFKACENDNNVSLVLADAEPFVTLSQTVTTGDLACIMESMEMMNPLLSEYTGTIETIHVDNG